MHRSCLPMVALAVFVGITVVSINFPAMAQPPGGTAPAPFKQEGAVNFVAYTPDAKFIITITQDGAIRKWDGASGKVVQLIEKGLDLKRGLDLRCRVAALSPDGKSLAVVTYPSIMNLYSVATGKLMRQIKTGDDQMSGAFAVVFAPDGKSVLTSRFQGRSASQWDLASGKELRTFGELMKQPFPVGRSALAVAPSGKVVVSEIYETKNGEMMSASVRRWDMVSGKELPAVKGAQKPGAVLFAPDGRTAAWGDNKSGTTRLWDLEGDKELRPLEGTGRAVVFSRDSKLVAGRETDGSILIWEVPTGKLLHRLAVPPANAVLTRAHALAFSADGKLLAGVENSIIHQWDVRSGKEVGLAAEKR